jgi:hypothetical protein
MSQYHSVQVQLELRATLLREAAAFLSVGEERESLLFRARRMDDASILIDGWPSNGLDQFRKA